MKFVHHYVTRGEKYHVAFSFSLRFCASNVDLESVAGVT